MQIIQQPHYEKLRDTVEKAGDPPILELIGKAKTRKTLPAMKRCDGSLATSHSQISDLIAEQLSSGGLGVWSPSQLDIKPVGDLLTILSEGPPNTTSPLCDVGYMILKRWYRRSAGMVLRLVNYGLRHDIEDWHTREVVLIQKANKPDYQMVKT